MTFSRLLPALAVLSTLFTHAFAAKASDGTQLITYQGNNGEAVYLKDDRRPALYTQNFGDCLGNSLIKVTSFDASYYKDNMTITVDIQASTNLTTEALMCEYPGLT